MSQEQITKVIGILTKILENVNIEINKLMAETKGRFESIKNHMMNLVKDHKSFKKWKTKSNNHNERRLNEKENDELKKKILELETSLKEKEQVINSIIESKQRQMLHSEKENNAATKSKARKLEIMSNNVNLI